MENAASGKSDYGQACADDGGLATLGAVEAVYFAAHMVALTYAVRLLRIVAPVPATPCWQSSSRSRCWRIHSTLVTTAVSVGRANNAIATLVNLQLPSLNTAA